MAFNRINLAAFSVISRVNVAKLDFIIFAVDKMNRNAPWNLNQTASYPLYKQPNSVRRCNFFLHDDQFCYPHVAGRRFENRAIFQTRQLPSDDTIWRLKPCQCGCNRRNKNCRDKICPWIFPRTIAILSASADRPQSNNSRCIMPSFPASKYREGGHDRRLALCWKILLNLSGTTLTRPDQNFTAGENWKGEKCGERRLSLAALKEVE